MTDEQRSPELAGMRRNYGQQPLRKADLAPTWHGQLRAWLDDAESAGLREPNAMVLATADREGRPHTRTVLLKDLSPDGLTFYTNYNSSKGRDLAANKFCSVTFPWIDMTRQVTVVGHGAPTRLPTLISAPVRTGLRSEHSRANSPRESSPEKHSTGALRNSASSTPRAR